MKINFKQPKYVIPLILYPFLFLFFYVYRSMAEPTNKVVEKKGMQENVADVSPEVKSEALTDKLDAYQEKYKEGDGFTAIGTLDPEQQAGAQYGAGYSEEEKRRLAEIDAATKAKFGPDAGISNRSAYVPSGNRGGNLSAEDRALATALSNLGSSKQDPRAKAIRERYRPEEQPQEPKEADPMETFKKQMEYMDSVAKSNDPDARAEAERQKALAKAEAARLNYKSLKVTKGGELNDAFNTIFAKKEGGFIKAIIDENIIGYSGSRIRIRLLDDIKAGKHTIKKGAYIYALISGFTEQRVKLTVTTILQNDKILPVELDIFDIDGLEGLYVPSSAFREFTRNLGGEGMSGFTMQNMQGANASQNQQQFLMSTIDKVFTSTSQAIANLIRKNKAKVKYNTYIYLIDKKELQEAQQNY